MEMRKRSRIYCDHCSQSVSKSTYYRHRADFYDEQTQRWCQDKTEAERAGRCQTHTPSSSDSEVDMTCEPLSDAPCPGSELPEKGSL